MQKLITLSIILNLISALTYADDSSFYGGLGFGSADYGGLSISGHDSEKGIFYGLGGRYDFTDNFAARLQWTDSDTGDLKIEAFRFSLEMNF